METTLTGAKLWIVVGILGFIAILVLLGVCIPDARTYVMDSVKVLLNTIPTVSTIK